MFLDGLRFLLVVLSLVLAIAELSDAGRPLKYKPAHVVERASEIEAKIRSFRTRKAGTPIRRQQLHPNGVYPFMNVSLDWETRVNDLVSRLSIDEMIAQMSHAGAGKNGPSPPIQRLGINPFQWTSECIHGYSYSGDATSFPQAINLAAMFDKSLLETVAEAIGKEVRAKHADYASRGIYDDHSGLSCYSPVINIMRHPFWGRSQETYGEDPALTGQLSVAYVRGLMGNDSRYIRANAVCKHFAAHNGPENLIGVVDRFSFNAIVSEVDMRLTFLPHFESCVGAGAQGVMCSYNSINGVPSCGNEWLLTQVLRKEWNFTGFVVSDEGAVEFSISRHHYYSTALQTAAFSTKSGLNLELSIPDDGPPILDNLTLAYAHNMVDADLLRERVRPLFYTRMRLGEFDPPEMNPYSTYNMSLIQSPEQKNISLLAAKRSFILLKWEPKNIIPIQPRSLLSLTLIGPFSNATEELFGDYAPPFDPGNSTTVVQGLQNLVKNPAQLKMLPACSEVTCTDYNAHQSQLVVAAVQQEKQLVVLAIGTGHQNEEEGLDRTSLALPGGQAEILTDVLEAAEWSNVPVIVLVFSATPVDISRAVSSPVVLAIYQCGFPAQETGLALFHVLSLADDDSNPAGRLPYTWYRDMTQIPDMIDYDMRNKTYRFLAPNVVPLFEFGYGLSYSQFQFVGVKSSEIVNLLGTQDYPQIPFQVTLRNLGPFNGSEVIQIYATWPPETLNDTQFERVPRVQLVAFERVLLKVNEQKTVLINVDTKWLRLWSNTGQYVLPSGKFQFYIGGQQPEISDSQRQSTVGAIAKSGISVFVNLTA